MTDDPTGAGALQRLEDALGKATLHDYASAIVAPADLRWALSTISDFVSVASTTADQLDEANARLLSLVNRCYGQF